MNRTILREVDLGHLSPSEQTLIESPMHRELRERVEAEIYEATQMREWFERKVRSFITAPAPWEYTLQFAEWNARLALARDKAERMRLGA